MSSFSWKPSTVNTLTLKRSRCNKYAATNKATWFIMKYKLFIYSLICPSSDFLQKAKNKREKLKKSICDFSHFPFFLNLKWKIDFPTNNIDIATNPCIYNLRMSSNCFFFYCHPSWYFFIIIKWKSNLTTIYFPCPPFPPFFISTQLLVDFSSFHSTIIHPHSHTRRVLKIE